MRVISLMGVALLGSSIGAQQVQSPATFHQLGHAILRELIETNTTGSSGNTSVAAEQLATRFKDAGIPAADVQVVGPTAKNMNLVVRYRGTGAHKPILLLAHLDVVEAKRADWTYDPFTLTEHDGYFYGRGTQDQKGGAAMLVTTLIRLKQEGWKPDRDLILALTAGEEGGMPYVGAEWLIANKKNLIDAEYCINVDAGGGDIDHGKHVQYNVQASEKVFHSVALTVKNPGGHSSLPRKDNAIYSLAVALERVAKFEFPAKPSEIVKAYFAKSAAVAATPALAADMRTVGSGATGAAAVAAYGRLSNTPVYNSLLRTTCVATQLEGGHAENALPQTARAVVNCRMLPGEDPAAVERSLIAAIHDTSVRLTPMDTAIQSPSSALRPDLFAAIDASVKAVFGPMPIVPIMETGATDGLYLRNAGTPVYGFSGLFIPLDDVRAHGKDERIIIAEFDKGLDFTYDILKRITKS